ncbi:bleomycin resistance protein [Candidatus Phycosocius bacilliformis]|uniref:Bleomycin resistance protein n=1 Tax=Candidatus Phycosocius bacilliformis TaxID=1445552 RepID=A0A2P2E9E8_9PROT|nr:bleomycin resistance protein [Candidatus Phycosocius bacilliformis]GBF57689.1 bleomycin resistance protein [Candidatus Phycosocius bacilliformis]
MSDYATPNLPSRDMDVTAAFYGKLGFELDYRAANWMILSRGGLELEFFPYPDLDPTTSSFSACWRVDDLEGLYQCCVQADIPRQAIGMPRIHPPQRDPSGLTIAYLIDPDGSLIRIIQNTLD